ncbi:MAG: peptidyl-prolyl cis-trans isomerase [Burkholderiales bacterium]|nr:MAG: peptidyl-prolyl cis-trans isomerase [Burkholderiales bacterium]
MAAVAALVALLAQPVGQVAHAASPRVAMQTSLGAVTIELYPDKAPATVENFLQYVRAGFYDGTIFHRVISNFVIQGGGFTAKMERKPTRDPIGLEAQNGLRNDRGWLSMARTRDPDSATSQFFVNLVDNAAMNYPSPDGHSYAVFGRVVEGMDVVDRIRSVPTGTFGGMRDVPREPVVIESARVIE